MHSHVDLAMGLLECPPNMAAGFSQSHDPRYSKAEAVMAFMTWLWKSHSIISVKCY